MSHPDLDGLPTLVSRKQAARALDVSERTVDRYRKQGKLETKRSNGHVLITRRSIIALVGLLVVIVLGLLFADDLLLHIRHARARAHSLETTHDVALWLRTLMGV